MIHLTINQLTGFYILLTMKFKYEVLIENVEPFVKKFIQEIERISQNKNPTPNELITKRLSNKIIVAGFIFLIDLYEKNFNDFIEIRCQLLESYEETMTEYEYITNANILKDYDKLLNEEIVIHFQHDEKVEKMILIRPVVME